MKNPAVLKKRAMELYEQMNPVGEDFVDSTGETAQRTDYNFDILRHHYAGTDFETEANSLCDVLQSIGMRGGDMNMMGPVVTKIRTTLKGDDGTILRGLEPYDDFIGQLLDTIQILSKAGNSPEPTQPGISGDDSPPNVKNAQAKLLELENYLQNSGLIKREKWNKYLEQARRAASVGDDSFTATPEMSQDDIAFLKESERQKMLRMGQKQAILQGLVGVNSGGQ